LEKLKNTISIGESLTENDLFVNILTKDEPEFNEILFDFIKENSEKIKNYSIMKRFDIEFYPLKNWDLKIKENTYQINNILPLSISSQEKLILKLLEEDGRIKIIDIAKSLKISAELALYKLNQLKKKEIILGNRILFNHEKFGYRFANLILNLKEISNETIKNIKQFCKNHKTINALSFNYGENNTIIQFLYKEDSELREGIRNVKSKLDTNIVSSKLLLLEDEKYVKTLPF
jgi:DNA-binding Lrp family transcriptional regulator